MKKLITVILFCFSVNITISQSNKLEFVSRVGYITPAFIDVEGNYLFVNVVNGFVIYDVTNKENPIELSSVVKSDPVNRAWSFVVYNDTAYSAWGNNGGLGFIDVKNKSNPVVDSKIFFPEYYYSDLSLQYPLLFAFAEHRTTNKVYLQCIDVSSTSAFEMKDNIDVLNDFLHTAPEQKKFIVDGNYLYLIMGPPNRVIDTAELHIFEISAQKTLVHKSSVVIGKSHHELTLDKKENLIFVASIFSEPKGDIKIVNVSNPSNPMQIKNWDSESILAANIDIYQNHLYLIESEQGGSDENFHIISFSNNDTTLTLVGSLKLPVNNKNFDIKVEGNYAFLNCWDWYAMYTINISTPSAPVVADTLEFGHSWHDVSVLNKRAYASIFDHYQLYTIDATNSVNPVIVKRSMPIGWGWGLKAVDGFVYMALGSQHDTTQVCGGLSLFDITNPDNPVQRGQIMAHPGNEDVQVEIDPIEKRAYVIAGEPVASVPSASPGLRIIDVSNPDSLEELGSIILANQCNGIHKNGRYAYIAASDNNSAALYIIDVLNPSEPKEIGKWSPTQLKELRSVFVKDNFAFITFGPSLTILNISDPENIPSNPPSIQLDAIGMDVLVKNNYCFVLSKKSLFVFDISTPLVPVLIDNIAVFNEEARHLDVEDEYIYVIAGGIYIYRFLPLTSVETPDPIMSNFILHQNYPNPFNPSTTIEYTLHTPTFGVPSREGNKRGVFVTLKVYDILGKEIATLVNEYQLPGNYEVKFNAGHSEQSRGIPSGIYFYKLNAGGYIQTRKMILLK